MLQSLFNDGGPFGPSRGFTLVELIMVIVIIGVLAAIVVPKFGEQGDEAKIAATKSNLENLRTALWLFKIQRGMYPPFLSPGSFAAELTGFDAQGNVILRVVPQEKITNSNVVNNGFTGSGGWYYSEPSSGVPAEFRVNVDVAACDSNLAGYCTKNGINPQTW